MQDPIKPVADVPPAPAQFRVSAETGTLLGEEVPSFTLPNGDVVSLNDTLTFGAPTADTGEYNHIKDYGSMFPFRTPGYKEGTPFQVKHIDKYENGLIFINGVHPRYDDRYIPYAYRANALDAFSTGELKMQK